MWRMVKDQSGRFSTWALFICFEFETLRNSTVLFLFVCLKKIGGGGGLVTSRCHILVTLTSRCRTRNLEFKSQTKCQSFKQQKATCRKQDINTCAMLHVHNFAYAEKSHKKQQQGLPTHGKDVKSSVSNNKKPPAPACDRTSTPVPCPTFLIFT